MKNSAFPKCYIDDIVTGKMSLFEWIELAQQLDAEGLELYERRLFESAGLFASATLRIE
jgi:hypothetical protein